MFHSVKLNQLNKINTIYFLCNMKRLQVNATFKHQAYENKRDRESLQLQKPFLKKNLIHVQRTINPDKKNDIESLYVFLPENHVRFFSDLLM